MAVLGNVPSITSATYATTAYDGTGTPFAGVAQGGAGGFVPTTTAAGVGNLSNMRRVNIDAQAMNNNAFIDTVRDLQEQRQQEKQMAKSTRRLVKVIIIDTDDNVPLDKCVLYSGDEKLTDATDQELFFEIDIKNILDKHNEYRITLKDKSVKERVENLEPVKIRDLRMVVVNVATF